MQDFHSHINNNILLKIIIFIINYYINYNMPAVDNINLSRNLDLVSIRGLIKLVPAVAVTL